MDFKEELQTYQSIINNELQKYLRKENNLLQEDVTAALGVCRSTCSHYERGFSIPSISKSMKLAEVFQTSISYLLTGKPDKNIDKDKKE